MFVLIFLAWVIFSCTVLTTSFILEGYNLKNGVSVLNKKNFFQARLFFSFLFILETSHILAENRENKKIDLPTKITTENIQNKESTDQGRKFVISQSKEEKSGESFSEKLKHEKEANDRSFRIGPTVSAGLFNFGSVGIESRLWRFLGLSGNLGGIRNYDIKKISMVKSSLEKDENSKVESTSFTLTHVEGRFVVYPFFGSFFMGAAFGLRNVDVKATVKITQPTASGRLHANIAGWSEYVTPQLGWMGVWGPGFMIGTELGVQIPVNHKLQNVTLTASDVTTGTVPNFENSEYADDIRDFTNKVEDYFLKKPLPFWNIIKIGWMF